MPDEGAALKAKLGEYGLRFAAGWHSTNLLVNDIETEKKALQAWIDFTRAAGGDHINACECSNTVHGNDKVAGERPPDHDRRRVGALLHRLRGALAATPPSRA